ncbi:MAG TPA: LamG domain-containing protein [Verrucomicrobiae bacterium]|jgi:hypothetical protein
MTLFLRRSVLSVLAAATWVGCASTPVAPITTNQPDKFQLTLDLRDGSKLIGQSLTDRFQFQSETLGKFDLPVQNIRTLEPLAQTNLVRLTTANGDVLSATLAMDEIRLTTSFGEVKLPVNSIKDLRVSPVLPQSLSNGLIGLWSGDGRGTDSIGGNNGTLRNISFTDGVMGKAFTVSPDSFPPGTWSGITIADQPAYILTNSMSIESWIRPRGDGYIILCRADHRPGFDPYTLSMQANHDLRFAICDNDNTSAAVDANIPYIQWTHVAAILNGDAGTMSLYTNGVLAAQIHTEVRPIGELISELSPGLGLGNLNDGGNNFPFIGDIDHVALYNRALTATEVQALYKKGAGRAGGRTTLLPSQSASSWQMQFDKY